MSFFALCHQPTIINSYFIITKQKDVGEWVKHFENGLLSPFFKQKALQKFSYSDGTALNCHNSHIIIHIFILLFLSRKTLENGLKIWRMGYLFNHFLSKKLCKNSPTSTKSKSVLLKTMSKLLVKSLAVGEEAPPPPPLCLQAGWHCQREGINRKITRLDFYFF